MPAQHGSLLGWFIQMVTDVFGTPTSSGVKTQMSSIILRANVVFHGKTITVNIKRLPRTSRWSAWSPNPGKPAMICTENDPEEALQSLKDKLEHHRAHGSIAYGKQHVPPLPSHQGNIGPVQQPTPNRGAVTPWVPPPAKVHPRQQTLPVAPGSKQQKPASVTETGLTPVMPKMDEADFRLALQQADFKEIGRVNPLDDEYKGFETTVTMFEQVRIVLIWCSQGWKAGAPDEDLFINAETLNTPATDVLRKLYQELMK